jgi:integral membrane protein
MTAANLAPASSPPPDPQQALATQAVRPQTTDVRILRVVSLVEGLSLLILVLVAMPLKYGAGMPAAVRVTGMAHGLLFVALGLALARVHFEQDWPLRRSLRLFLLSFVPFGFVLMERDLRRG